VLRVAFTVNSQSLILKSDTRGRVLTPAHRRETLLDEFERSGLSGVKFAALSGIKYSTFANRRRRALKILVYDGRGFLTPMPFRNSPNVWVRQSCAY